MSRASLADRCDVLVENFATGVMDRLGLGAAALQQRNPEPDLRLGVRARAHRTGVARRRLRHAAAMLRRVRRAEPASRHPAARRLRLARSDVRADAGVHRRRGALAARRHGGVARVDFSMIEAMLWTLAEPLLATQRGAAPVPRGNRSERHRPHGAWRCAGDDEWIALAVGSDAQWRALCSVVPGTVQRETRCRVAAHTVRRRALRTACRAPASRQPRLPVHWTSWQRASARTGLLGCTRGRRSAGPAVAHQLRPTSRCRTRPWRRHRRSAARRTRSDEAIPIGVMEIASSLTLLAMTGQRQAAVQAAGT